MSESRKLAAILAADVVGYSRLAGLDEDRILARLRALRSDLIDPTIAVHHGRVVKRTGDGALVEFRSVVDAVRCAIEVQNAMLERNAGVPSDRRIEFRIGIHIGDVVEESDGDLMGDGVNIAARLEGIAAPGAICLSEDAYRQVRSRLDLLVSDLGQTQLKNIAEPMRIYSLQVGVSRRGGAIAATGAEPSVASGTAPIELPEKPSIAVLPFTNLSSDPEQEYFGEGLAEDLITDLSKVSGLMVIARNSSFAYGGKSADIRSVARDLHVRYVVEGSVRRAASRVRINAQLIDAQDQSHIWADRFDGDLADVFDLQDKVVAQIVRALSSVISTTAPSSRRRTNSIPAYDLFVKARSLVAQSAGAVVEARPLLDKALVLDPEFAEAYATLAFCYWMGRLHLGEAREPSRTLALLSAERAVSLDPKGPDGYMVLGLVKLYDFEHTKAESAFETALRVDPNHADSWAMRSDLMVMQGRASDALTCVKNGLRLNPLPPGWYYWALGQAQYAAGTYSEAVETLRREETYSTPSRRILAASLARLGLMEEARGEAAMFLAANPYFRIQEWVATQPFLDLAMRDDFVDGYKQAGIP